VLGGAAAFDDDSTDGGIVKVCMMYSCSSVLQ